MYSKVDKNCIGENLSWSCIWILRNGQVNIRNFKIQRQTILDSDHEFHKEVQSKKWRKKPIYIFSNYEAQWSLQSKTFLLIFQVSKKKRKTKPPEIMRIKMQRRKTIFQDSMWNTYTDFWAFLLLKTISNDLDMCYLYN